MIRVYGKTAVETVRPDGLVVAYLCRRVIPLPAEAAAWAVTGPEGQTYRVRRYTAGGWGCGCADFAHPYRRGRKRKPGTCKHTEAVSEALAEGTGDGGEVGHAGDRRAEPPLPDDRRGDVPVRVHERGLGVPDGPPGPAPGAAEAGRHVGVGVEGLRVREPADGAAGPAPVARPRRARRGPRTGSDRIRPEETESAES